MEGRSTTVLVEWWRSNIDTEGIDFFFTFTVRFHAFRCNVAPQDQK